MTLSIDWINPLRGNGGAKGRGVSTGVRVYNLQYKDKTSGVIHRSTHIRLGPDTMQFCRFVVGDRVLIGVVEVSGKDHLAIKRDPTGHGFTLSNAKGRAVHGSSKDYGVVKMKRRGIPEFDVPTKDCAITDDGVLLVPMDASSHDRA